MPSFTIIAVFLFSLFCQPVWAFDNAEPLPPDQVFKVSAQALTTKEIELSFSILDGYYLYRDKIKAETKTAEVQLETPSFPEGETRHDSNFGDVIVFRHDLKVPVRFSAPAGTTTLQLSVKYQGCADKGLCYPPMSKTFDLNLPAAEPAAKADPLAQLVKNAASVKLNLFEDELLAPDKAYQFFATVKDANTLHVNWEIAPGYYLYKEKTQLELIKESGVSLGAYAIPAGTPKEDEAFGKVEVFHDELSFDVPLDRSSTQAETIILKAKFQGCADRGVCYPPMSKEISLNLPATASVAQPQPATSVPLSEQDQIVKSLKQDSLAMTLLTFFGFGLLLSLTPCVFPMVPILSGIIIGHGKNTSVLHGFLLSLSYVTASAITYTIFGVLAAVFGSNLQVLFQQPWIIALFSTIFMLLALSMFGFYHLDLPDSIRAKLHNSSEKHRNGSFWGAAIMGALSSLIVGPCVAAPLAGALIYIGQTGNALLGGSALFVMGIGMGAPLLMLGASAGKLLPQKGDWLNSVNAVFGVIMLAVAVWMLSRILPAEITILLWSLLLIVPAIYLNALDSLPEHSSGWRKLWKGLGVIMLAYGLILLVGFGLGNSNPLKPLQGLGITSAAAAPQAQHFEIVSSIAELETKLQQAKANHQLVMLDFYADWCISCKEMEAYTFTDATVKQHLTSFMLLQADVTNNTEADKALLAKFKLIGPPGVIFYDKNQQELQALRVIGYQDAAAFAKTLERVKS